MNAQEFAEFEEMQRQARAQREAEDQARRERMEREFEQAQRQFGTRRGNWRTDRRGTRAMD